MISKRNLLKGSHLYVILDRDYLKEEKIFKAAKRALSAGASMIQLRDKSSTISDILKTAKALKRITLRYGAPFIINDRLDVALAVDADGIHIGHGDIDISLARRFLQKGKMIGVSARRFKDALAAKRKGASYLGVGPVFKTPIKVKIKPKGFKLLNDIRKLKMPFFAIGGIDCVNIFKLAKQGFRNVAVIRAICEASDPYVAARRLKEAIT